jgi:hypothetical protein
MLSARIDHKRTYIPMRFSARMARCVLLPAVGVLAACAGGTGIVTTAGNAATTLPEALDTSAPSTLPPLTDTTSHPATTNVLGEQDVSVLQRRDIPPEGLRLSSTSAWPATVGAVRSARGPSHRVPALRRTRTDVAR